MPFEAITGSRLSVFRPAQATQTKRLSIAGLEVSGLEVLPKTQRCAVLPAFGEAVYVA